MLSLILIDFWVVAFFTTWYILIIIVLYISLVYWMQRTYIKAKREFVRLESITKSPIQGVFTEIINNLTEIRSMNLQQYFGQRLRHSQDENLKNSILILGSDGWFN